MQSNLEVDALLSWLTVLLGHEQSLDLETIVKRSLFVDALRVIGPSYVPADAASRPGFAFDEAIRKFDRAELFFPPDSPLLHVDWQRLVGAEDLSVLGRHEAVKVLKILLGAAVKCKDKARFVQQLQKEVPAAKQKALMMVIQNELLKEAVVSREEQSLRARVFELEQQISRSDTSAIQRQNVELQSSCAALELEVHKLRNEPAKIATEANGMGSEEQRAMKERLRVLQEELVKRETEIVNLTAVAAEAAACVRSNRTMRDELDLLREQLDMAKEQLSTTTQEGPSNAKEVSLLREQLKAAQAEAKTNESVAAEGRKLKMELSSLKTSVIELQQRNNEVNNLVALKTSELKGLTESFIGSKRQIGELSLELENAKMELKQNNNNNNSNNNNTHYTGVIGGSLMDDLIDPRDELIKLLEEERDQLLNDLKTKKMVEEQNGKRETSGEAGVVKEERDLLMRELQVMKELLNKQSNESDVVKQERDCLLNELKSCKLLLEQNGSPQSQSERDLVVSLQTELAAQHKRFVETENEKNQLRNFLKLAKEKLSNNNNNNERSGQCGHELEIRLMTSKVHAAGLEIVRLKHDLSRRSAALEDKKVNGLLNHLRHLIDPYD